MIDWQDNSSDPNPHRRLLEPYKEPVEEGYLIHPQADWGDQGVMDLGADNRLPAETKCFHAQEDADDYRSKGRGNLGFEMIICTLSVLGAFFVKS